MLHIILWAIVVPFALIWLCVLATAGAFLIAGYALRTAGSYLAGCGYALKDGCEIGGELLDRKIQIMTRRGETKP